MRQFFSLAFCFSISTISTAQHKRIFTGMYVQWGYNVEAYTRSNIHFKMANGNNFVLHKAKARHKPDFEGVYQTPLDISIPQYNYRLGFYLNPARTKSLELNFDHIKYVVTDGQTVRVTGTINGKQVDADSILDPEQFLHLEHTDGGNLLHLNYVTQHTILMNKTGSRPLVNSILKIGAGINIPRTDFTYKGDRLNNKFHIAGYNISAEAGVRYYFAKRWFAEGTGKTGFVKYLNALVNTTKETGNRVRHSFGYLEGILLIGYDISFKKR